MTIPSSIGTAPPDRLVPLPRAMNGTPAAVAQADGLDHVLRRFGDDDGPRPRAERREAVRLVGGERAWSSQKAIGWHQPGEIVKKRCVGHGGSEDTATVALWRALCLWSDP